MLMSKSVLSKLVQSLIVGLIPLVVWAGPVDINKADAGTIAKELTGAGKTRSQAIVAYREKNGAFKNANDLIKVRGVGAKFIEKNKANIRYEGTEAAKKG
jgi:competence protein ComEA